MDGYNELVESTLNHDLGDPALVDTRIEIGSDFIVFYQFDRIISFITELVRLPAPDNSKSRTYRICFLTHLSD